MTYLCHSEYSECPPECSSNADMETPASLVNGVVNNTVTLQLTHESDAASSHSHPALLSLLNYAPDFVVNWIDVGCSATANLEVHWGDHDLLDYCTFGVEAQTFWANTACEKDHTQKNLSTVIRWYRNLYKQIASDVGINQ